MALGAGAASHARVCCGAAVPTYVAQRTSTMREAIGPRHVRVAASGGVAVPGGGGARRDDHDHGQPRRLAEDDRYYGGGGTIHASKRRARAPFR